MQCSGFLINAMKISLNVRNSLFTQPLSKSPLVYLLLSLPKKMVSPTGNQEFGTSRTLKNPLAAGALPRIPANGAYSAPSDPLAGGKEAGCPLSKNLTTAFRPRASAFPASLSTPYLIFDNSNPLSE